MIDLVANDVVILQPVSKRGRQIVTDARTHEAIVLCDPRPMQCFDNVLGVKVLIGKSHVRNIALRGDRHFQIEGKK